MNNDNESKAYPCDEQETKRSYPCDTDGEAFSYADNGAERHANAASANSEADDAVSETAVRKGKGRRGGNAAASVVVHSGNFRARKENEDTRDGCSSYGGRRERHGDKERSYSERYKEPQR